MMYWTLLDEASTRGRQGSGCLLKHSELQPSYCLVLPGYWQPARCDAPVSMTSVIVLLARENVTLLNSSVDIPHCPHVVHQELYGQATKGCWEGFERLSNRLHQIDIQHLLFWRLKFSDLQIFLMSSPP